MAKLCANGYFSCAAFHAYRWCAKLYGFVHYILFLSPIAWTEIQREREEGVISKYGPVAAHGDVLCTSEYMKEIYDLLYVLKRLLLNRTEISLHCR